MKNTRATVQRQFGSVAENYATSAVHAGGEDLDILVKHASLSGSEIVLDAGCGAGHAALVAAPLARQVVAYDLTPAMLEQVKQLAAARQSDNIRVMQGDVEQLAFGKATFDRVISRYSAHHWPHPLVALREFTRVLKPGGQFILSDVVAPDDATLDTFLQAVELLRDPSHVRDHTIEQWLAFLRAAGFEVEIIFTWDLYLDFTAWVTRMATPSANVAMIKTLFDGAPVEVRQAMHLQADYSFVIKGALLRGVI